ncbi:MAG: nucleoside hydrolase [Clostridia bacterium]|nr:nucleoside hydrolase [Clostridia bacterium]
MVNLIIDTDLGNDCDDAAAIALACRYVKEERARLLAITINTSDPYSPCCAEAILSYYGVETEIGVHKGSFPYVDVSFSKALAEKFGVAKKKEREAAVRLIRRKLAESKDKSVTLVFIGQLNNANELLKSPADEYGEDGVSLVERKVKETVIMGGMFGSRKIVFEGKEYLAEYNIATSVSDSKGAIGTFPCEVVFADFYLGIDVLTLGGLIGRDEKDPVGYAYDIFSHGDRPSWDILALMYAVEGENGLFVRSRHGRVRVGDTGTTVMEYDESGKHRYLLPLVESDVLATAINKKFGL